jgi:glyoxylase I family protein
MQLRVEHLGLAARNPASLKDWYVRVLGAELVRELDPAAPSFLLRLPGAALLEIYPADFAFVGTGDNKLAGWRHLALRVDSLEAARVELEPRGVKFTDPVKPAGGGGRVQFFADAEGNLLHLVERPADWKAEEAG